MSSQKKDYPYKGTDVSIDASKIQISKLLRDYGVEGAQWLEVWSENKIELRFPITVDYQGVRKRILVGLKPPLFLGKHRTYDPQRGYLIVTAPDLKASMRALFTYVKGMLEAQAYGLAKIEDVFMSHILISIDGREATLGDKMRLSILKGDIPALEDQSVQGERD